MGKQIGAVIKFVNGSFHAAFQRLTHLSIIVDEYGGRKYGDSRLAGCVTNAWCLWSPPHPPPACCLLNENGEEIQLEWTAQR